MFFEKLIWETIYRKVKETQANIGWGRTIRVMDFNYLIHLVRSFNLFIYDKITHLCGPGVPAWVIDTPQKVRR